MINMSASDCLASIPHLSERRVRCLAGHPLGRRARSVAWATVRAPVVPLHHARSDAAARILHIFYLDGCGIAGVRGCSSAVSTPESAPSSRRSCRSSTTDWPTCPPAVHRRILATGTTMPGDERDALILEVSRIAKLGPVGDSSGSA